MNEPMERTLETLQMVRLETDGPPTLGNLADFVAACNAHSRDTQISLNVRDDRINCTETWELTLRGKGDFA